MKPRENNIDAMPLSGDEHEIQFEMVKRQWCRGCQIFLLNPVQARQIAEHELTGTCSVQKLVSSFRASKGRAHAHSSREDGQLPEVGIDCGFFGRGREDVLQIVCVKCRNNSTGCMGTTVIERKGTSDHASSFLTAFIKRSGIQENSGEIRQ